MCLGSDATVMTHPPYEAGLLPGRAALRVAGEEARHFLHDLLTADIESLAMGEARYAGLLTPQGKILFDLFLLATPEGFLVDCARSRLADLVKRLTFYRLRAKVTVAPAPDLAIGVSPAEPEAALRYRDPRTPGLGWRFLAPAASPMPEAQGYDAARISAGVADSDADLAPGEIFPHEANFDQFGAVSFAKGCYIGQEVVSRMEHRGLARTRLLPVAVAGASAARGAEIRAGEVLVGHVLSVADGRALALLRLDRLADARAPLLTGGVSVEVLKPDFVRYAVPGYSEGRQ
jgi:folate-binding protein YgfZ